MPPAAAAAKLMPNKNARLNGVQTISERIGSKAAPKPILGAGPSAALRDELLEELKAITTSDDAAIWAHRNLGARNSLAEADAAMVDDAFQAKLAILEEATPLSRELFRSSGVAPRLATAASRARGPPAADGIDKSRLAHPELRRCRDKQHLKFVAKWACLICGRRPADAHHLRFAQHRALGRKVSDEYTVPLCRGHHREAHRSGDEATWWKKVGVDPTATARALWLETHPLPTIAGAGNVDRPSQANVGIDETPTGLAKQREPNSQTNPSVDRQ